MSKTTLLLYYTLVLVLNCKITVFFIVYALFVSSKHIESLEGLKDMLYFKWAIFYQMNQRWMIVSFSRPQLLIPILDIWFCIWNNGNNSGQLSGSGQSYNIVYFLLTEGVF